MKNLLLIFTAILLFNGSEIFSQYINNRIFESASHQIEPTIVRHPTNPQILFASAFTISPTSILSEGIYVSTNGGNNWSCSDINNGPPVNGGHGGDPGPVIDKNGVFLIIHLGFSAGNVCKYFIS